MTDIRTIELSEDGTVAAITAFDLVFDAVAESAERGLTWADVDGKHQAAIVSPEFGLFIELLMKHNTVLHAEIVHPDGTRQKIGPDLQSADDARYEDQLRRAWGESVLGNCRNCGKSRAEHCRGHLMPHCSGFCYGTRPPEVMDPVEWEQDHTWSPPAVHLDPPSSRSAE